MEEGGRNDERMEDGGEKEGRRNGWRRVGKIEWRNMEIRGK